MINYDARSGERKIVMPHAGLGMLHYADCAGNTDEFHYFCSPFRRGVRVAEGARLESVYRGNCIAGSNPALSASFILVTFCTFQCKKSILINGLIRANSKSITGLIISLQNILIDSSFILPGFFHFHFPPLRLRESIGL